MIAQTRRALAAAGLLMAAAAAADEPPKSLDAASILAASSAADWRAPDPSQTLYLELAGGRVVIELAPAFAPQHVAQILALARSGYYDGLAIIRVQDNYVVQWGDPDGKRETPGIPATLPGEYFRSAKGLDFTPLPDGDVYAPEVGFVDGFPGARDGADGRAWLAHCYGMVGAGRDLAPDSGGGRELYVVIGHAPRHLDRNVTLVGRVLAGIELLSTLPRGSGALGFYENAAQRVPIRSIRVAAEVPATARSELQVLRTDTDTFRRYVDARRNRREDWFLDPVGHVELCNVPLVVRAGAERK